MYASETLTAAGESWRAAGDALLDEAERIGPLEPGGSFYPFVTSGRWRQNARRERQLAAALAGDLRLEREPELWYPLWEMPLEPH